MSKRWNVAVVGATGLVGQTMLSILEQRDFPVGELFPLASARSVGDNSPVSKALATLAAVSARTSPLGLVTSRLTSASVSICAMSKLRKLAPSPETLRRSSIQTNKG